MLIRRSLDVFFQKTRDDPHGGSAAGLLLRLESPTGALLIMCTISTYHITVTPWSRQRSLPYNCHPSFFRQKKRQRVFEFFYNYQRRNVCGGRKMLSRKMLIRRSLDVFFQKTRDDSIGGRLRNRGMTLMYLSLRPPSRSPGG